MGLSFHEGADGREITFNLTIKFTFMKVLMDVPGLSRCVAIFDAKSYLSQILAAIRLMVELNVGFSPCEGADGGPCHPTQRPYP
jgi:hypothetical protein